MDLRSSLREATLADLGSIVDLHSRSRAAYYGAGGLSPDVVRNPTTERAQRIGWTSAIRSVQKRVLCAIVEEEVVGIAAMGPPLAENEDRRSVGQLYQIHVVPERWSSGIGSMLHSAFVAYLTEASLRSGLLEVWERNTRARSFYERLGWRPDGGSRPGPDGAAYLQLRFTRATDAQAGG